MFLAVSVKSSDLETLAEPSFVLKLTDVFAIGLYEISTP